MADRPANEPGSPAADSAGRADPNADVPTPPPPNTRPGPTDEGGHGGMATREQEARLRRRDSGEPKDGPSS